MRLAEQVIRRMKQSGIPTYNGLHLRTEKDAQDWSTTMGGEEVSTGASDQDYLVTLATPQPDCSLLL